VTWMIYILKLNNGAFYTGITNNIDKRMDQHARGRGSKCVRSHLPFSLVYQELVQTKSAALKREAQIKRLSRVKKEELIEGGFNE
jgi:putative endonuclease